MKNKPDTFYRYRSFSTQTLDSLCHDQVYFAHPGSFNDPLDCSPTLRRDSGLIELRRLLEFLVKRRVSAELLASLNRAQFRGDRAAEHARLKAEREASHVLQNIAYNATDPDYEMDIPEVEASLLTYEIERELLRYFESGVCCFSTTYSSPLLWSHYGDQHQGLCIGYGLDRRPVPLMHKVVYGGSRDIKTSVLYDAFISEDWEAIESLKRDVLLRKARGWGYEKEWRLIGQQGLQDSPLLLKEVTFGLRCPAAVKHAIARALDGRVNAVDFFEMFEVRGSYALRRARVDIGELRQYFPYSAISGEEAFGGEH